MSNEQDESRQQSTIPASMMKAEYSINYIDTSDTSSCNQTPIAARRVMSDPGLSNTKSPPPVTLSTTDVDPELLKLQIEWADLLMNDSLVIDVPPECDLSRDKQQLLAARW